MGTNYYLERNVCPECGKADESWHIGKSSAGWCFALHIMPDRDIHDLPDWLNEFEDTGTRIIDEYGREVSAKDMVSIITERGRDPVPDKPYHYSSWAEFHRMNQSEWGPNHMLIARIDGNHCTGHGKGTWSLNTGEFS